MAKKLFSVQVLQWVQADTPQEAAAWMWRRVNQTESSESLVMVVHDPETGAASTFQAFAPGVREMKA